MLANIDEGNMKICVGNMKMCVGNQILEVGCPRATSISEILISLICRNKNIYMFLYFHKA